MAKNTIFYKKIGNRYIPVSEYNDELSKSYSYGSHLVTVNKNSRSRRKIDPEFAPVIAACLYAQDAIIKSLMDASAIRPKSIPLTQEQKDAWDNLSKAFGDDKYALTWTSAYDTTEEVIKTISQEVELLMSNPAVKNAYEEFMVISKLSKE